MPEPIPEVEDDEEIEDFEPDFEEVFEEKDYDGGDE